MHNFLLMIFIFSLNGSTYFGLPLVHHQEQHLIRCTVQLVHTGTSGCCNKAASPTGVYVPIALYRLLNVAPDDGKGQSETCRDIQQKIKTIHKNLCISLVYIHVVYEIL